MEDVFEYVMSSPWFSTDLFLMDKLSSKERNRDKKRSSFNLFEQYLSNLPKVEKKYPEDKEQFVLQCFPNVRTVLEAEEQKYREQRLLAQKFNGALVMKLRPELKGKALGEFLKDFMQYHGATRILGLSESELQELVLAYKY